MAKKKAVKKQPVPLAEPSFDDSTAESTPCSQPTPQRPETSPYISSPVAFRIGPQQRAYYVPRGLLQNPVWTASSSSSWGGDIHLPDVDEYTGHVIVHYLYTGAYQTLHDKNTASVDEVNIEFRRAVLVYTAAKKYNLRGLGRLARNKIEQFGKEMDIFVVVKAIKDDFSRLLGDTAWFHDYLDGKVKAEFEKDRTVFARDDLFGSITDVGLIRVLAKCVVGLHNDMIERMLSAERVPVVETSEECRPEVPDPPIDEGLVKESDTAEAICLEECLDCPAQDSSVDACPLTPDYPAQVYPTDNCSAPEYLAQDYPAADCSVAECPYPADDCPAPECPLEDFPIAEACVPEDCTEEPLIVEEPEPVVEHASEPEPAAEEGDPWGWATGYWNKNVTVQPVEPTEVVEELVSNGESDVKADPEQPAEAEAEICPVRVKHLLDGDEWKHCRQCRAMLRQVTIQLARAAHTDENGYEIVDQILVK